MDKSISLEAIKLNIVKLIDNLHQLKPFDEELCNSVLSELELLQEIKSSCKYNSTSMDSPQVGTVTDINELASRFRSEATELITVLQDIISVLNADSFPAQHIQQATGQFSCLSEIYDSIQKTAERMLPKEELPAYGSSIGTYSAAIANSKALQLARAKEAAKAVLSSFITVQSDSDAYAAALAPFQEEAARQLALLTSDGLDTASLTEIVNAPSLFLEMLSCDDPDSDQGMELSDKLAALYPKRVTRGLDREQYYIKK